MAIDAKVRALLSLCHKQSWECPLAVVVPLSISMGADP